MSGSDSGFTAIVLQGGGALGAYQAGAVVRLAEDGRIPDFVAGISVGAINAALIAGNPPDKRIAALQNFWNRVTETANWPLLPFPDLFGVVSAFAQGASGFFSPRFPPAAFSPPGDPADASFYDTAPLKATLEELVDFDLIDHGPVRLAIGTVDVASGNFVWFDSKEMRIGPEHVMASGAMPPGFPAIEIGGVYYWDGGLVSNTPLRYVVDRRDDARPMTVWQIDLFSARGPLPHSVWQLEAREKDIRYSSRTRLITDALRERHALACALSAHRDDLPASLREDPAIAPLLDDVAIAPLTLIHLIYRSKPYETGAKDYDFSRSAMSAHWAAGVADATRMVTHPELQAHDGAVPGMRVFDLTDPESAAK